MMDKQEFFLLIPAIIYGVAIVDLLKIFSHKKNYIEVVGWGMFTMLVVIFNWIELYNKLELITSNSLNFFLIIIQAILFAQIAGIITPEEKDADTKKYFFEIRRTFFWLISAGSMLNILLQFFVYDDHSPSWLRPVAIVFFLICAYSDKFWIRISVLGIVFVLTILRVFSDILI